ncbi:1,4-dihydroxy-2-naphthoyl-CoA synthase [Humibacter sp.]|jgi:naphthoate synthase|uniref:1,4-dihydroxy-2-naphthoyl-CoA synthase n=1 Tax=Humibacter sp. TaxID=1940291 RepID=UPI002C39F6B3|nr:1,4-dihydroxy-2-naphthoyl-CoA synthase [Humibacter sp.]HVX07424.1 1,4-dihydroxy-2-naphthoyl-CoA synthase [Humibacter sp.]
MSQQVSELFDADEWVQAPAGEAFTDITYHLSHDGRIARVAFDRPEVRNAFRPHTVDELYTALDDARQNPRVGVVLLTGNGPSPKDGGWAFCSGGDQRIRGRDGYKYSDSDTSIVDSDRSMEPASETDAGAGVAAEAGNGLRSKLQRAVGRLHILEVQRLIRFMPKVVIAVVPGWAAGGGHSLHAVCDLTIASAEHGRFKQTDADVGSFDAGYGSAYYARQIGQKLAREVFFLAQEYSAQRAYEMGAVNAVVPHAELETTAIAWARIVLGKSPTSIRMLKFAFNAVDDGLVGQQVFAGEATRLAYGTDEAVEGRDAFLEKREPDWSPFPWQF